MVREGTGDEVSGTNYDALDAADVRFRLLAATHILFIYSRFRFISQHRKSAESVECPGNSVPSGTLRQTLKVKVYVPFCMPLQVSTCLYDMFSAEC